MAEIHLACPVAFVIHNTKLYYIQKILTTIIKTICLLRMVPLLVQPKYCLLIFPRSEKDSLIVISNLVGAQPGVYRFIH